MRKPIAFIFFFLSACLSGWSQSGAITTYTVVENSKWLDGQYRNGYSIALDANQPVALNSWASMIGSGGAKTYFYDPDNLIFVTENADLPQISPQKLKVYAHFEYDGMHDATLLTLWFQQPDGSFVTTENNPEVSSAIYKFMMGFRFQSLADLKDHIYREQLQIAKNRFPNSEDVPVGPMHPLKGRSNQ